MNTINFKPAIWAADRFRKYVGDNCCPWGTRSLQQKMYLHLQKKRCIVSILRRRWNRIHIRVLICFCFVCIYFFACLFNGSSAHLLAFFIWLFTRKYIYIYMYSIAKQQPTLQSHHRAQAHTEPCPRWEAGHLRQASFGPGGSKRLIGEAGSFSEG